MDPSLQRSILSFEFSTADPYELEKVERQTFRDAPRCHEFGNYNIAVVVLVALSSRKRVDFGPDIIIDEDTIRKLILARLHGVLPWIGYHPPW